MLQIRYPRLMHLLAVSESVLCSSIGADKMFKEVVVSAQIREITFRLAPLAVAALFLGEES